MNNSVHMMKYSVSEVCLCLSKALPRRRVSVAVVPKFNLLNIPGQTPATAGPTPGALPALVSPISSTLPRQLLCCSLSADTCN